MGTRVSDLIYDAGRFMTRMVVWGFYGYRGGSDPAVPRNGACLIVANHQSFWDPIIVGTAFLQRRSHSLARNTLFKGPFGVLLGVLKAVPVDQDGSDTAAIRAILERLKQGHAVVIYPEGSRTFDGSMTEFKRGVAVLVKRAGVPVVPFAIEGAFDAWPRTRARPFLFGRRIAGRFGTPVLPDELMRDGADAALRRLEREIDAIRLELRSELRQRTSGRFPPPGPGDELSFKPLDGPSVGPSDETVSSGG